MSAEENSHEAQRLDGNAAAGLLREVFAIEMTTAIATCANCSKTAAVGQLMLYGGEMGAVLRCPYCTHLVLCITHPPDGYWLDLRGATLLRLAQPG